MLVRFCLTPVDWATYRKYIQDAICRDNELLWSALLDDDRWFLPRTGNTYCYDQKSQNGFDEAHKPVR